MVCVKKNFLLENSNKINTQFYPRVFYFKRGWYVKKRRNTEGRSELKKIIFKGGRKE
jgi:hypothetical protein